MSCVINLFLSHLCYSNAIYIGNDKRILVEKFVLEVAY